MSEVLYRFRMNGFQFQIINNKLNGNIDCNLVLIGTCGVGELNTNNNIFKSYSLKNEINFVEQENINSYVNSKEKDESTFVIFHSYITDEATRLYYMNGYKALLNSIEHTSKELTFIFCFIMDENEKAFSYVYDKHEFNKTDVSCVVSDDINYIFKGDKENESPVSEKQVYGKKTTELLSKLTIGVVGASGTGSIVVEQLYRLGTNTLLIVDNDIVENRNLGRILNSSIDDVNKYRKKVDVLENAIKNSGLKTNIIPFATEVAVPKTIRYLSQCDVIFGCVDSIDGRHQINKLCTYYSIPYFDIGVKLTSDGVGGISEVSYAINYLKPGGSSLMSRGLYNTDTLSSASLKRSNPEEYKKRLIEKYIIGANEDQPAVVSVNMQAASMCVQDFLARIHKYREEPNSSIEAIRVDLTVPRIIIEKPSNPCEYFSRFVGIGDKTPLLNMPILSEED